MKRSIGRLFFGGGMALFLAGIAAAGPAEDGMVAARRGDFAEALRLWRPLADQGDATAEFGLGVMYANGQGVPMDKALAVALFRKAAEQGLAKGEFNLGVMYATGQGVPQDTAAALNWTRKAADQGYADAEFNLGVMFANGQGVARDYAQAAEWYRKAADQGYAAAEHNLGLIYVSGQGVPQDYASAALWFRKAADQNFPGAQQNLQLALKAGGQSDGENTSAIRTAQATSEGDVHASPAETHRPDKCLSYVGTSIVPQTFDSATARFSKLTPKGEFETSAQYGARKSAAIGGPVGPLIIGKSPDDRNDFTYDADAQMLRVGRFAFNETTFDTTYAFIVAKSDIGGTGGDGLYVVTSLSTLNLGSYIGTNAFGAHAQIFKHLHTYKVIYERPGNTFQEKLFGVAGSDGDVGAIPMSPSEARIIKPQLRVAFVITPKDPYILKGGHEEGDPTITNQSEDRQNFTILVADFQCGLVTDAKNKVLAAYPAN